MSTKTHKEITVTKSKGTKKAATKRVKSARPGAEEQAATPQTDAREELCVFAFRLTEAERDAIHKAAGPAKASRFARTLLVAAARRDAAGVSAILEAIARQ